MIRKMDELGRIVIPKEWREHAGMESGVDIAMHYNEDSKEVTIKKSHADEECAICGSRDILNLFEVKNKYVCNMCIFDLNEYIKRDGNIVCIVDKK